MKRNKLGFMSLLSLLGILGIAGDESMLGFFGFACYIRYFFVNPDELFLQNVRKAASIGFFSGVGATGAAFVLHYLFPAFLASSIVLVSCFVVSVICFTIALLALEIKEQQG